MPSDISGKSSLSIAMDPLMERRRGSACRPGRHSAVLDGAERLDVEVDRRGGIVDDKVGTMRAGLRLPWWSPFGGGPH